MKVKRFLSEPLTSPDSTTRGSVLGAVLATLVGVVLVAIAAVAIDATASDSDEPCTTTPGFLPAELSVASSKSVLWTLKPVKANASVNLALDDYTGRSQFGGVLVNAVPTSKNKNNTPIPEFKASPAAEKGTARGGTTTSGELEQEPSVAALYHGNAVSDGKRAGGLDLSAWAILSPDGRSINVRVCASRKKVRADARPGSYRGTVRVYAERAQAVDIPVTVTIKASRTFTFLLILLIAFLGAAYAAFNSKEPDLDDEQQASADVQLIRQFMLTLLPVVSGVIAGVVTGYVIYLDNPTFGALRGGDTQALIAATLVAAVTGLTFVAPPSRSVKRKLANSKTKAREASAAADREKPVTDARAAKALAQTTLQRASDALERAERTQASVEARVPAAEPDLVASTKAAVVKAQAAKDEAQAAFDKAVQAVIAAETAAAAEDASAAAKQTVAEAGTAADNAEKATAAAETAAGKAEKAAEGAP